MEPLKRHQWKTRSLADMVIKEYTDKTSTRLVPQVFVTVFCAVTDHFRWPSPEHLWCTFQLYEYVHVHVHVPLIYGTRYKYVSAITVLSASNYNILASWLNPHSAACCRIMGVGHNTYSEESEYNSDSESFYWSSVSKNQLFMLIRVSTSVFAKTTDSCNFFHFRNMANPAAVHQLHSSLVSPRKCQHVQNCFVVTKLSLRTAS